MIISERDLKALRGVQERPGSDKRWLLRRLGVHKTPIDRTLTKLVRFGLLRSERGTVSPCDSYYLTDEGREKL